MTLLEQARALTTDEIVALLQTQARVQQQNEELEAKLQTLEQKLDWLQRQVFGTQSERRVVGGPTGQLLLGQDAEAAAAFASRTKDDAGVTVPSHQRRRRDRGEGWASEQGLRFGPDVPVEEICLDPPEIEGLREDEYDVITERVTHRLAQRPGSYFVVRYLRKVVRLKADRQIASPAAPPAVLERSFADVSLLAGLCVEKFVYHLPLHRQHRRLKQCGIAVDRSTLTHLVHRTAELLQPIVEAQRRSILQLRAAPPDPTVEDPGREAS